MRYDLTDLKLFIYIGETSNLTRAAEKIFLSLPAASARVKNLEDTFKVRLLDRQATGVTLTPAGEILFKYAKSIIQKLEQLHDEIQPFSEGMKGRLRVLANAAATYSFMTEILAHFLKENPDVDIALEEKSTKEILTAIRSGAGDLGIVSGDLDLSGLDCTLLFNDSLVAIINSRHELRDEKTIAFEKLVENYQFVGIGGSDSVLQSFLANKADALGKRLHQRVYAGSFEVIARMVSANVGIAVIPMDCAIQLKHFDDIKVLRLTDSWANRQRYICRLPGRALPYYADRFIDSVEHVVSQMPVDGYLTLNNKSK